MSPHAFFATAPLGTESALATELAELGAQRPAPMPRGVAFEGDMDTGYRALLWSRIASRILLRLAQAKISDTADLDALVASIDWAQHVGPDGSIRVMARTGVKCVIPDALYLGQRVKDGIVDQFRARFGRRPDVDRDDPDLHVHVHLGQSKARISLDLAGMALHRRGYREGTGTAPIKEHLAAAILRRAGWLDVFGSGGVLLDPCCGSGTFLCEAFAMATQRAPGVDRRDFALFRWKGFDAALWEQERASAQAKHSEALNALGERVFVWGADQESRVLDLANASLRELGASSCAQLVSAPLAQMQPTAAQGLVVANPPWGQRMGGLADAQALYAQLGQRLREDFEGWSYAILTGDPALGSSLGIYAPKRVKIENAKVPMQVLLGQVHSRYFVQARREQKAAKIAADAALANRLRKRDSQLRGWVTRDKVQAYRLYDADLPEYALAIDRYGEDFVVQEYQAPKEIPEDKARARLNVALFTLRETMGVTHEQVFLKKRARQRGRDQYERMRDQGVEREIQEGNATLLVNLSDYLDTGLFLDHRKLRLEMARMARNKRFLNLFCYTATASVHAALGGAASTLSVDLSSTYLDWAERNFERNRLDPSRHQLLRADCLRYLEESKERFDLIFLDPPTFSNSKAMRETMDIQRDHPRLIELAMKRLSPGGLLVFSCNARKFRLDPQVSQLYIVQDWSGPTTSPDFARKRHRRHCFQISAAFGPADR